MADKEEKKSRRIRIGLLCLDAVLVIASIVMVWRGVNVVHEEPRAMYETSEPTEFTVFPPETEPVTEETTEPEEEETVPAPTEKPTEQIHLTSTATIGATGDILLDLPIVNACQQEDGSYNFDPIFQYLRDYSMTVDYAVASLETTLAGTETGFRYSGFSRLNSPDEIVTSLRRAGFDMLLTANEHSYDTRHAGLLRTVEVIEESGLRALGTVSDARRPNYAIVDINGIKVGMLDYTYETDSPGVGYAIGTYLNGLLVDKRDAELINSFHPDKTEQFAKEIKATLKEMKNKGAEATIVFLHWGKEYSLKVTDSQQAIAQRLCDLGVDVIIGSHPHVLEPVELLSSTVNPEHKTVCLYSLGNAVSNQRFGGVARLNSAHMEDGSWATVTFSKYSDGKVYLDYVQLIPTWTIMRLTLDRVYSILPLDESVRDGWASLYSLNENELKSVQSSSARTGKIVGSGLAAVQEGLTAAQQQREADYQAAWLG